MINANSGVTLEQNIWVKNSDRHIFLKFDKDNEEIVGINYFQGYGTEIKDIKYDRDMLNFYRLSIINMGLKSKRFDLETIDSILWLYATWVMYTEDDNYDTSLEVFRDILK